VGSDALATCDDSGTLILWHAKKKESGRALMSEYKKAAVLTDHGTRAHTCVCVCLCAWLVVSLLFLLMHAFTYPHTHIHTQPVQSRV
jgi:hypothetical protein